MTGGSWIVSEIGIFHYSSFRMPPIALQSVLRMSMKRELARAMLAAAILIPPTSLASQSALQDSSQTSAPQVEPSTPNRKPQKVYHIGGDVKAPRVISSFQPSLDEEQIRQLSAGKKVAKTGSTVVGIIVKGAWNYLLGMFGKWPWLERIFGSAEDYKASLCAYYMSLSVQELASRLAEGGGGAEHRAAKRL